jgi:hypothetical protein
MVPIIDFPKKGSASIEKKAILLSLCLPQKERGRDLNSNHRSCIKDAILEYGSSHSSTFQNSRASFLQLGEKDASYLAPFIGYFHYY